MMWLCRIGIHVATRRVKLLAYRRGRTEPIEAKVCPCYNLLRSDRGEW